MAAYILVQGQKRKWPIRVFFLRPIMLECRKRGMFSWKDRRQSDHAESLRTYYRLWTVSFYPRRNGKPLKGIYFLK